MAWAVCIDFFFEARVVEDRKCLNFCFLLPLLLLCIFIASRSVLVTCDISTFRIFRFSLWLSVWQPFTNNHIGTQGRVIFSAPHVQSVNIPYILIFDQFFKVFNLICLFYFWLPWFFVALYGLSLAPVSGGPLCCSEQASHCTGFSCRGVQAIGTWAPIFVAHGLGICGWSA